MFPILRSWHRPGDPLGDLPGTPESIPWDFLQSHEEQALRNHDQTLEKLAQRGGLGVSEALAIHEDRAYKKMDRADALQQLTTKVSAWLESMEPK